MEQHKLLQKQIKKFLTDDCLTNPLFQNFINAINDSYFSFERDKEIMNHAFQESEKEYQIINSTLNKEYELKKQSIAKLYDSIKLIDNNYSVLKNNEQENFDDIFFISKYLNHQVENKINNELAINSFVLLQQVLMEIASDFINLPSDKINDIKNLTLKKLGQFVTADRAYIFEYDFKNQTCSNTFEWCNEGIEPQLENLQNVPLELMKEWVDSNARGEIMSIPRVEDLDESEIKQILTDQDIKSLLVLPILGKDECLGFVGFDSVKKHYNYTAKEKDLLFFFAQMIANVDQRNKIELDLKYNVELLKIVFTNLQSGIIFEDENNTILFANQLFCDLFSISDSPENLIGLDCANCIQTSKDLFVDSERFPSRISEILHLKSNVVNEVLEMKSGTFLERDYIPLYVNNEYKGHLWKYNDITQRVKSQTLLKQSEERSKLIMESALNAIINFDSDGKIIFWNRKAEQIFGWKKEEVLGIILNDNIIPNQLNDSQFESMSNYLNTGDNLVLNKLLELPALKKDGTSLTIEIAIIPIKQNGELFFCSFIQDISERKKAEIQLKFQEQKFRNMIANMNLGLIEVDIHDRIQFANQSFSNISGYSIEELLGKNPASILLDDKYKEIVDSKRQLRKEGISDIYQVPIKNKKGETRWWAISGASNYNDNGDLAGSIGIHLDITEQKLLEFELEKEKERALAASKAKEIFLATMSHEIRTPLNAIIGFLREFKRVQLSIEQKTYIENISFASSHLLSIINNVLDISKIEAGEMEIENVEFGFETLINKVLHILSIKAKEKNIELKNNIDPSISKVLKGDALRIEQILFNLIGNSLKFTDIGSVVLKCSLIKEYSNKQEILISIIDTGIGIDETYLKSIFTKFSQEEKNTSRKYGGTGLGMTITKELVSLMNGEISIQSHKNEGTTVEIKIVLEKGLMNLNNDQNHITTGYNLNGLKILLVEDNEFNRVIAKNSLKFFNCNVEEAINGLEAVEILKKFSFDIILMDIQMPVMDGIEATTIIRNELKITTPIIAFTANAFKTEIDKFKNIGINDYVIKPFDEDVFYKTLLRVTNIQNHNQNHNNNIEKPLEKPLENQNYDLSILISMSRGDNDFVQTMIKIFIDQTEEVILEIEKCLVVNDFIEISKLIHKIKPNIDRMGISSIWHEVRELENIAKNSVDKERIEVLFSVIKKVLIVSIIELKKLLT
jgi:PAS domain S-box-containing protein